MPQTVFIFNFIFHLHKMMARKVTFSLLKKNNERFIFHMGTLSYIIFGLIYTLITKYRSRHSQRKHTYRIFLLYL